MGLLPLMAALTLLTPPVGQVRQEVVGEAVSALVAKHGEAQLARVATGVGQVARSWRPEDGTDHDFKAFCEANFIAEDAPLQRTFERIQAVMEQIDGSTREIQTHALLPFEREGDPPGVVDDALASFDLAARAEDELYRSKVAFVALLNFPVHTLRDRPDRADAWDRATWARSRMMDRFASRIDAEAIRTLTAAYVSAGQYVAGLNIHTASLVDPNGRRLYAEDRRLSVHWGLRDEIKALYADPDGLPRQRALFRAMERFVTGDVPKAVIADPAVKWCPEKNEVFGGSNQTEPDARYAALLAVARAERALDRFTPITPNFLARRFDGQRQMTEESVTKLIEGILSAPHVGMVAKKLQERLGRPLEPIDLWHPGFQTAPDEAVLDMTVREKYPDAAAFAADIPRILARLGFSDERAAWLARHIVVEPSRGAGHALAPAIRTAPARLRTRFGPEGMDYKSYNIAIHELGHCVEQVFSLYESDHWFLRGVPNEAFTEALAFLFQYRDLELLGQEQPPDVLGEYWATYGTAGSALVDIQVWRWLHDHPEATAAELRAATVEASMRVWNTYFSSIFGRRDSPVLGVYSHIVANGLYLPDYVIGRVAAFQLRAKITGPEFGAAFARTARVGNLTPDAWMSESTGSPLAADELLRAVWALR